MRPRRRAPRARGRRKEKASGGRGRSRRAERERRGRKRRRKGLETQGRGEEEREESNPPEVLTDKESFETVNPEKEAESSLEMFKRWLETEETGGLSVAQTGALLALSVWRSGTPLGSYLHQVLQPRPDDGDSGRRQRGDSSFTAFT